MSKSKYSLCYPGDIYAQLFKRQTHFSVAAFQIRFYKLKYRTTFSELTQNRLCTRNRHRTTNTNALFLSQISFITISLNQTKLKTHYGRLI